uniref:Cytosol aminopeptidase n=1 Tax=Lygus hesperus TaxID=30085 RepID=A0A0A9VNX2_LYGHE
MNAWGRAARKLTKALIREFSDCISGTNKKGLVLGAYEGCDKSELKLTPTAAKFDESTGGKLKDLLKREAGIKKGTAKVFSNVHPEFFSVAVAGLGREGLGSSEKESMDLCKENIRCAAGIGAAALQDEGIRQIFVEEFTNAESAAEGAALAVWKYQAHRRKESQTPTVKLELFEAQDREGWQRGMLKAECQNLARKWEETPSNLMTPIILAQAAMDTLCPCGVTVEVREKDWLESKKFNAFLSMAKGSCEEPLMVELSYCGSTPDDKPITFVGKGVTFDSGGTCLKKCEGMSEYRGDMAGAAVLIALFRCVASMALPINIRALIPLCENMIGGMALRPGDVLTARNGKSVVVEDTDNEGRIILLDALNHANMYLPCMVMTIATLTPGNQKGNRWRSQRRFFDVRRHLERTKQSWRGNRRPRLEVPVLEIFLTLGHRLLRC